MKTSIISVSQMKVKVAESWYGSKHVLCKKMNKLTTVKSFNFMGTTVSSLRKMNMFCALEIVYLKYTQYI